MATNINTIIINTLLKTHKAIESATATKIHNRILRIIPAIPSPTTMLGTESRLGENFEGSILLYLSITCPRLSLSLTPLNNPVVINVKNAMDWIVVEMIEFSKNVLCNPSPKR
jgi:hypothetical protein